ncbi:MAG: hypothetical protein ACRDTP_00705, partial [Mycobacteriales bacterium]
MSAPSDGSSELVGVGVVGALVAAVVGAADDEVGAALVDVVVGDVFDEVGASDVALVCGVVAAVVGEVEVVSGAVGVPVPLPSSARAATTAITAATARIPATHQPQVLRRAGRTAGSTYVGRTWVGSGATGGARATVAGSSDRNRAATAAAVGRRAGSVAVIASSSVR